MKVSDNGLIQDPFHVDVKEILTVAHVQIRGHGSGLKSEPSRRRCDYTVSYCAMSY